MSAILSVFPVGREVTAVRIGSNGAGEFFAGLLIAGYSVHPDADPTEAAKVRGGWVSYFGKLPGMWRLDRRETMLAALGDTTEDCAWVRLRDMDRKQIGAIGCPRLKALVVLYHMASTYWDYEPEFVLRPDLLEGVRLGTRGLELAGSSWATQAVEAYDLMREAGEYARVRIG
jgi:hypothetical protein